MSQSPVPGHVCQIAPAIRRVLAPNPSPMTLWGTNTFLVGTGAVAVIDPGPDMPDHLTAILAALSPGEHISHIFVTHAHLDHSPLARALASETGAPVLAFGDAGAGQAEHMRALARAGLTGGGEGVDTGFTPDIRLADGETVTHGNWALEAIWTPGHMGNHMCFALGDVLFSGDHVMGWASSLVSPPDGDLTAFMQSCKKLAGRDERTYFPAHGDAVTDPAGRLGWLISHRKAREKAILGALSDKPRDVDAITRAVYHDTPEALFPAARRNVFAHLIDLTRRALVRGEPTLSLNAKFVRL